MPVTADVMAIMKFVAHLLDAEESGPVYMRSWRGAGIFICCQNHLRFQSQDRNGFDSFCVCGAKYKQKSIKKLEKIIVVGEKSGILYV